MDSLQLSTQSWRSEYLVHPRPGTLILVEQSVSQEAKNKTVALLPTHSAVQSLLQATHSGEFCP